MATPNQPIKLSLTQAPLLVVTCFYGKETTCEISWPNRLSFAELSITDSKLRSDIEDKLEWIKRQYEILYAHKDTRRFAEHVAPYLAKVNVTLFANPSDLSAIAERLKQLPLIYAESLAQSLEKSLKVKAPAMSSSVSDGKWVEDTQNLRVISAQPLNELELGLPAYYQQQTQPWAACVSSWLELSYEQKVNYLLVASRSQPSVQYRVEIISEPQRLLSLIDEEALSIESWQQPNPSFGYELPKRATDGGMMERCFDASYKLYGDIQPVHPELTSLFVLWGHRQRSLVEITWRQILNLQKISGVHSGFAKAILTKVAEKHPLLIESLVQPGK